MLIVKTKSLKWATWLLRCITLDLNFRIFFLKHVGLFITREIKVGLRSIIHNPIKSWPAGLVLYAHQCRHLSCAINVFWKHVIFLHKGSTYFFNGIRFTQLRAHFMSRFHSVKRFSDCQHDRVDTQKPHLVKVITFLKFWILWFLEIKLEAV